MKHFDSNLLERIQKLDDESGGVFVKAQRQMFEKTGELQKSGLTPESEKVQAFAKDYWDMIMEYYKGDMSLFSELSKLPFLEEDDEWKSRREFAQKAMTHYLSAEN